MFCPKCGSKISDDARYCTECGLPLEGLSGKTADKEGSGAEPLARESSSAEVMLESANTGASSYWPGATSLCSVLANTPSRECRVHGRTESRAGLEDRG